jgi:hypothetical protein
MKKLICLMLSLCFILTLTACGNKDKKNDNALDLEYYAKLGQIPEAKFTLGANPDQVIDELDGINEQEQAEHQEDPNHNHDHDQEEFYFEVVEGQNNVLLDNGNICYYYNKANKDKGISYIVSYDSAYGFELGTVILEVKEALEGYELTEEPLTEENAFFASHAFGGTILKAELETATVIFVFQENELFATAIYNDNWIN